MSSSLLEEPHLLSSLKEDVTPIKKLVTLKGSNLEENIVRILITKEPHMHGLVVNQTFIISLVVEFVQRDQIMQLKY